MTEVCCGVTVSESVEGISWVLLLLLLHTGVLTVGIGGMAWTLLLLLLHTEVLINGETVIRKCL